MKIQQIIALPLMSALIPLILLLLLLPACSDDSSDPNQNATLIVSLTDAPADYDAVNITFSEISAHIDNDWITISGETQTINLLDWANGNTIELGRAELGPGKYTQIRLMVTEATVEVDGTTYDVTIPSAEQTGLKLNINADLEAGSTYEIIIDFDAEKSIIETGNGAYKLKPVIRATTRAATGSISGTISNYENGPVATALQNGNEIGSTPIDETNGAFRISFLEPGDYDVLI